jgi:hypothetical protein
MQRLHHLHDSTSGGAETGVRFWEPLLFAQNRGGARPAGLFNDCTIDALIASDGDGRSQ